MGLWRLLGRLIKVSDKESWLITDESAGRLIYERFDQETGKSGGKSDFYVVKYAKVFSRNAQEGEEVQARLQLDLNNTDMVQQLQD